MESSFRAVTQDIQETQPIQDEDQQSQTRRKNARFGFQRTADWDFFTAATGAKTGYLENLSAGGALLRTTEPIEHRRWIRMIVREKQNNLWFTAVGRIMRREDKMEAWDDQHVTLHRYGIEFIQPLNPMVLERIQETQVPCATCGDPSASIPDLSKPNQLYCVLCHLRQACHNLLVHDGFESA